MWHLTSAYMGGRKGGERWRHNQIFLAMGLCYKVLCIIMYYVFLIVKKTYFLRLKRSTCSSLLSIVTGIGRARTLRPLQSSPRILETPLHVPFSLQWWDVIAKSRGYINTAKGRGGTKLRKIFQSVSRLLSKIVWSGGKFFGACATD